MEAFGRLSDESRYRRFFEAMPALNDAVLTYLTKVDHRNHSALIAFEHGDDRAIAVARYVRRAELAVTADIAVTVVDDSQDCGVGRALLSLLIERAARAGFERLSASVLATNRPTFAGLGVLSTLGALATASVGLAKAGPAAAMRRALENASAPLRALHSGVVGDYVAWITLGLAGLSGSFLLALR